ncbi:MAG TPA: sigma factor-like helix-turn-helix DNA-binding protein [Kofleriaceae bacterium]|nr:sigma factor-like helix-turn-helix DNA-binding protein [Kofleriaceae bacterium]
MSNLAAVFLDARGETASDADRGALEGALSDAVTAATSGWPTVRVDPAAWIRALAELAPKPLDLAKPLGEVLVADHYLAFACAAGDPAAVAECNAILVREAGFAADGTKMHASVRDEATQIVRATLLAPREGKPPAIGDYAGRGALRSWLRVCVSRELVRIAKAQQRIEPLEEHLVADPGYGDDPALEELKAKYRAQLADAFRTALTELPARERTLLRYQLIDGLTIDEIGGIFRVHRATAARWIAKIRDDLVMRTREMMAASLGVDTSEAASIVRLVQSQLDVSVIRHLGPPPKKR